MYKLLSAIALGCCFTVIGGSPVGQLKLIGGQNVTIEQYPYQASLMFKNKHKCAGAIISSKHVITHGECYNGEHELWSVRVGSSHYNKGGKVYKVKQAYLRLDYYVTVVIFELSEPLEFGAGVQKVDLAPADFVVEDDAKAVLTGWGSSVKNGPLADQLHAVELTTISRATCKSCYYGSLGYFEFCATYQKGGRDAACDGDAGDPLVSSNVLIGLVPPRPGCGEPRLPALFDSIAADRRFIDSVISKA